MFYIHKHKVLILVTIIYGCVTVHARTLELSPGQSIQEAITSLSGGDTLLLHEGIYREVVTVNEWYGTIGSPLQVQSYPGEKAIIDGTIDLKLNWTKHKGNIYKARLDRDIWQLFIDGKMVDVARTPDGGLLDGSIWDMQSSMMHIDPDSIAGTQLRSEELKQTGIDFSGCVVGLATGHWTSSFCPVTDHRASSDILQFEQEGSYRKHCYFYLMGLPCLDRENEWWFDQKSRTIYLWTPQGQDPSTFESITARVCDYGLVVTNAADITFRDVEFFACGPYISDSHRIRFEYCEFQYPIEAKFMMGHFDWFSRDRSGPNHDGNNMFLIRNGSGHALIHCVVAYCNSPVGLLAEGILIKNCLFHDIEWDVNSSGGSGSIWVGGQAVVLRNTFHHCGNSEGLRPRSTGATIAYNHLYKMSLRQIDGAAINCGEESHRGIKVHHNWVHHCNREGIRFDYPGRDRISQPGSCGNYSYNVMWNCQLPMVKGDYNLVHNNVSFNHHKHSQFGGATLDGITDLAILGFRKIHPDVEFNRHTLVRNNIARLGHVAGESNLPCREDHNYNVPQAALKSLRDPLHWDFRPDRMHRARTNDIIDAGAEITANDKPAPDTPLVSVDWQGSAPDIGAYEYGDNNYWIPGRQIPIASTPIPPDRSQHTSIQCDLMWLAGQEAEAHLVYFGTDNQTVATANTHSSAFKGEQDNNIYDPGQLQKGVTYFWRIDTKNIRRIIKGQVWSFTP